MEEKRVALSCAFKSRPPHVNIEGWKNLFKLLVAIGAGLVLYVVTNALGIDIWPGEGDNWGGP